MLEEIKQKEFERFMQEFMYEIRETNNYYVLENMMKDYISQALKKRDGEIIEFINSGYNSPASDTGYSICLDDVINFINSK